MTLIEFLQARIAEDEAVAQEALDRGRWTAVRIPESAGRGTDVAEVVDMTPPDKEGEPERGFYRLGMDVLYGPHARHVARWDPARVLADCEAKRRIVAECREVIRGNTPPAAVNSEVLWLAEPVLRAVALPYAAHPDYREEWRP